MVTEPLSVLSISACLISLLSVQTESVSGESLKTPGHDIGEFTKNKRTYRLLDIGLADITANSKQFFNQASKKQDLRLPVLSVKRRKVNKLHLMICSYGLELEAASF